MHLFHLANPTMSQVHTQQANVRANFLEVYLQSACITELREKVWFPTPNVHPNVKHRKFFLTSVGALIM